MLKILIIDDTRSVHAYFKALLAKAPGITTVSAFNGEEGLSAFRSEGAFDAILLDWEMPVMTGPETLAHLMALKCQTPVIMVTTKNAPDEILRMLELGAAEYMMKPFTADILFEKLEAVTGKGLSHVA